MRSRPAAVAATLLVALATLLGPTSLPATAEGNDPMAGAPAAGTCYDATLAQADKEALEGPSGSCSTPHTLWVLGSAEIPADLTEGSAAYNSFLVTTCRRLRDEAIGDNQRRYALSDYGAYLFLPTTAQQDAGSRWVSCTLGLYANGDLLRQLIEEVVPLADPLDDRIALCSRSNYFRPCSQRHDHRATVARLVDAPASEKNAARAANRICPARTTSPKWTYRVLPVSKKAFYLTCLNATRR